MNKELVRYIMVYFSHLQTTEEQLAVRHTITTQKLSDSPNPEMEKMYIRNGWLTDNPIALDLLKDGYDIFAKKVTERVLTECEDQVFLNNCPKCGKLARTPKARQCRFCGHSWRDSD